MREYTWIDIGSYMVITIEQPLYIEPSLQRQHLFLKMLPLK